MLEDEIRKKKLIWWKASKIKKNNEKELRPNAKKIKGK
jgi:hypothetical protein